MKRTLIATSLGLSSLLCTAIAQATSVNLPSGSNLVYGDVSNGYSIMSAATNPAAGASTYKPGETNVSFGILSSIGGGAEIGDVDNIFTQIDAKATEFSQMFDSITASSSADASAVAASITTTINDTNSLLSLIEQGGYAKGYLGAQWPLMPIQVAGDWLGGSLVFDASSNINVRLGLVEDPVNIVAANLQNDITNAINSPGVTQTNGDLSFSYDNTNNVVNFNVTNDTTAIIKASRVDELSLAYSRNLWSSAAGNLFAGIRGKYLKVQLYHDFARIAANTNSQNLFDNASIDNSTTNNGFGIDAGTLWVTPNYHLGATLTNINEPSFDYNLIDMAALGYTDASTINKLQPGSTYTMKRQLKLEGALFTENKHWIIGAAMDANAVEDSLGDKYQWSVLSVAYLSNHWWLPAVRAGYRNNRAGSKLSYLTAGVTLFKGLNIDFAYSPSKVEVDGSSQPRSLMVNVGLEVSF